MEQKNIEKIVLACQKGDIAQFGTLFDLFHNKIYQFIYYRTHHKETAEDLTSQTFTKALVRIESYNPEKAGFTTWLYQIARNSIIDYYRALKPTSDIQDAWDLPSTSQPAREAELRIQLEKVNSYLQSLPSQQRDIILMRVWDGLSHKEIADILGISEASSKMTFSRVLAKLTKEVPFAALYLLTLKQIL
ncbi:MAG TPA: sigma-70 family RNA polymerase sigma factor [Patescibacteria group bacterium]|nr:sigma-70 family RNA polymerase sigma factor [Patescibacteria group bacterium]